jgi:putative nucleotidyltransferase with HDIG domain
MQTSPLSYQAAWDLLCEWTEGPRLRTHALAVAACMRHYATHFGADAEYWAICGLLHDFDYEKHPDPSEHPTVGITHLRSLGYPEDILDAIAGHALYLGVERTTSMAKALFAVDELSGMIMAVAYMRPNKTLAEVEVSQVVKKLKDKSFARGVNRDDVALGVSELGIDLETHIANCIAGMQARHQELGA